MILNQDNGPGGLNEKKILLDNIENYAGHVCLTLHEQQEIYVGKLTEVYPASSARIEGGRGGMESPFFKKNSLAFPF